MASVITETDAKYAIEHSSLLDPTRPEVRFNAYPSIASVQLTNTRNTNVVVRIDLCGGMGLFHDDPFTFVFRYQLPQPSTVGTTNGIQNQH